MECHQDFTYFQSLHNYQYIKRPAFNFDTGVWPKLQELLHTGKYPPPRFISIPIISGQILEWAKFKSGYF